MSQEIVLKHEFVEFIPDELEQGTIHVSIRFATASHLCCCGCGSKVVTPLRPTDWKLIFDGKTISLDPSIGNWSFACQSHYWIRHNRVKWARQWSQEQVGAGRMHDTLVKDEYFGTNKTPTSSAPPGVSVSSGAPGEAKARESGWQRLKKWFGFGRDR